MEILNKDLFYFYKRIKQGQQVPTYMGLAWPAWDRLEYVCMLIPFNVIARILRNIYFWFRNPPILDLWSSKD